VAIKNASSLFLPQERKRRPFLLGRGEKVRKKTIEFSPILDCCSLGSEFLGNQARVREIKGAEWVKRKCLGNWVSRFCMRLKKSENQKVSGWQMILGWEKSFLGWK
jgi:hypothetical protein